MNILITGATGYIGSHLVKALAERQHTIDALDINLNQNDIRPYVNALYQIDIRRPFATEMTTHYDVVVHIAAETKVSRSVTNPYLFYETNITGTHHTSRVSCDKFIHCSTGAAFNPSTSPYALSKRASEDLIQLLPNYSTCRFYNVSGNDGFKKIDTEHYHLLRRVAATANGLYDHVPIFGDDYDTPDGTTIRNYTHIVDIVNAMVKLVESDGTNQIECLGNTSGYSVKEVISVMEQVSGTKLKTKIYPKRLGDSIISVLPKQSDFFEETKDIVAQCESALRNEM